MLHSQAQTGVIFRITIDHARKKTAGYHFSRNVLLEYNPGRNHGYRGILALRADHQAGAQRARSARQPPQSGLSICSPVNWFYTNAIDIF